MKNEGGFEDEWKNRQTNRRTNEGTFVIVDSISRLKISEIKEWFEIE